MAIATSSLIEPANRETTVEDADEVHAVLNALQDDDCRAVLEATDEESLSASELADACNLPLSTTYRKLDVLTEAELLAERTRLCPDGKHASEYVRVVDEVLVDAGAGFELTISRRELPERNAHIGAPER